MNRRAFLATAAPIAFAGCGLVTTTGGVTTVNASAFAADAQLIVTGLNTVLANPTVIAGIPSASVAKVQAAIVSAEGIISQIAAAGSTVPLPTGQAWMTTLGQDVALILPIVASIVALPPPVSAALTAIEVLLPVVQAAVQIVTSQASASLMTPVQARALLAAHR